MFKKTNKPIIAKEEKDLKLREKYPFLFKKVVVSVDSNNEPTKIIYKKRSLVPVYVLIVLLIFGLCFTLITFPRKITLDQLGIIFVKMFQDSPTLQYWGGYFGYMTKEAIPEIWNTVGLVFISTTIGSLVSVPLFLLAARNCSKHAWIYMPVRAIINIVRTIPTFVLAVVCVCICGVGSTAGIWAMSVFTLGVIFKLMYEYVETCDMNPFEAMSSTGATRGQAFMVGVWPQVSPAFISNIIYTFEINIRASVVLGFVGAGGIGTLISDAIADRCYEKVGCVLVPLFIVVLFLQLLSSYLRRKLQ